MNLVKKLIDMKRIVISMPILFLASIVFVSCNKDSNDVLAELTGNSKIYQLNEFGISGFSGEAKFEERKDNTTLVTLSVSGVASGESYPAFIYMGSTATSGSLLLLLTNVSGDNGQSETNVATLNDGTAITYTQLTLVDANIKLHKSDSDLGTILATADIGVNELSGKSETFVITDDDSAVATLMIEERISETSLVTLTLAGGGDGILHPAHIHENTEIEGGGIIVSLNNTNENSGISLTDVTSLDNGSEISFEGLLEINGHLKVHKSQTDFATIVYSGDIGQNILTGNSDAYQLTAVSDDNISGTVIFYERKNSSTLVSMQLTGTSPGANHATHIHQNTALSGGSIEIGFNNVIGDTGISETNIVQKDDGTPITYDELVAYNGHIVVHPNPSQFSIVAKGDIGQNVLTGNSEEYKLDAVSGDNISGSITFYERKNSTTLASMQLSGTTPGANHATHIHQNTALAGGSIKIGFNNVIGDSGKSESDITEKDDGTPVTYDELITYDGHVVVHPSPSQFSIVAKGDIGSNALTGESKMYILDENGSSGVSGSILFEQRINGFSMATIQLSGTAADGDHPAHIHENSVSQGGTILIDFNNVIGTAGLSKTDIMKNRNGDEITYEMLLSFNGHIVIHKSLEEFGKIIVNGNIGSNAN